MKVTATREQQEALWHILNQNKGWMLKREILAQADYCLTDRAIRAVCSAQPQHFLSSQRGYKLVRYATAGELEEAIADLASREKCLRERREALERVQMQANQAVLI